MNRSNELANYWPNNNGIQSNIVAGWSGNYGHLFKAAFTRAQQLLKRWRIIRETWNITPILCQKVRKGVMLPDYTGLYASETKYWYLQRSSHELNNMMHILKTTSADSRAIVTWIHCCAYQVVIFTYHDSVPSECSRAIERWVHVCKSQFDTWTRKYSDQAVTPFMEGQLCYTTCLHGRPTRTNWKRICRRSITKLIQY